MTPNLILTASPEFAALAVAELPADAHGLTELVPGVYTAVLTTGFFALAETWRTQRPIFVRHICPVQQLVPLTGQPTDLGALATCVADTLLAYVDPALPLSVQSRCLHPTAYKPYDINQRLADLIAAETAVAINIKNPQQVLSVCTTDSTAYLGLSLAQQNLSSWAGGVRRLAREKEQISRAEFKLLEAMEQFGIDLPPQGHVLDLGAAPGGWTRVLRQRGWRVTAVDPAQLHPSLQSDKQVHHLRMAAEVALTQHHNSFDLIVNDMRLDARDSARLMVAYAPQLVANGRAIVTLKLPEHKPLPLLEAALAICQSAYVVAGVRHLFHNRSEVTVALRKRPV